MYIAVIHCRCMRGLLCWRLTSGITSNRWLLITPFRFESTLSDPTPTSTKNILTCKLRRFPTAWYIVEGKCDFVPLTILHMFEFIQITIYWYPIPRKHSCSDLNTTACVYFKWFCCVISLRLDILHTASTLIKYFVTTVPFVFWVFLCVPLRAWFNYRIGANWCPWF